MSGQRFYIKLLAFAVILALLLIALSGCSPENPEEVTATQEPDTNVNIEVPEQAVSDTESVSATAWHSLSPAERQAASTIKPEATPTAEPTPTPQPTEVPYEDIDVVLGLATPVPTTFAPASTPAPTEPPTPEPTPRKTPAPRTPNPNDAVTRPTPAPTPIGISVAEAIVKIQRGETDSPEVSEVASGSSTQGQQGGVKVTVNSVRTSMGDKLIFPADGNRFVIISLTVKNEEGTSAEISAFSTFSLLDAEKSRLKITLGGGQAGLLDGILEPGQSMTGDCGFEVPQELRRCLLEVNTDKSVDPYYIEIPIPSGIETVILDETPVDEANRPNAIPGADNIKVGELAIQNENTARVTNVRLGSGGIFETPPEGSRYIVIDLDIENTGNAAQTISTLLSFRLLDGRGQALPIKYDKTTNGTLDGLLESGEKRSGSLSFEVPASLSRAELEIRFNLLGRRDYVLIDIPTE